MPIINVTLNHTISNVEKKNLIHDLTFEANRLLGIPPEKIMVKIDELPSDSLGRGGVVLGSENFEEMSRRDSF